MSPNKDNSALASKAFWGSLSPSASQSALARQYVSDTMWAGIAFTATDTFKCVISCFESGANDNINQQPTCVKVYSWDGATLRATLLALLHHGPATTEWAAASGVSRQALDGDAATAAYTTVLGDRLVLEIGGQVSSAGGSGVVGTIRFGSSSTTDLLENETATGDFNPWFETSKTIAFGARQGFINFQNPGVL